MTPDPDARALATLRADATFYRRMFKDFYHLAIAAHERIAVLERQLAETRAELTRYSRERVS